MAVADDRYRSVLEMLAEVDAGVAEFEGREEERQLARARTHELVAQMCETVRRLQELTPGAAPVRRLGFWGSRRRGST